jgi:hypothetical protein
MKPDILFGAMYIYVWVQNIQSHASLCLYFELIFWKTCTMRTINWIFTIFHDKDDEQHPEYCQYTVCLFNATNIYVCAHTYGNDSANIIKRNAKAILDSKCAPCLFQPINSTVVDLQSNFWLLRAAVLQLETSSSWRLTWRDKFMTQACKRLSGISKNYAQKIQLLHNNKRKPITIRSSKPNSTWSEELICRAGPTCPLQGCPFRVMQRSPFSYIWFWRYLIRR